MMILSISFDTDILNIISNSPLISKKTLRDNKKLRMKQLTLIERMLEKHADKETTSISVIEKNKDVIIHKLSDPSNPVIVLDRDSILDEDLSSFEISNLRGNNLDDQSFQSHPLKHKKSEERKLG